MISHALVRNFSSTNAKAKRVNTNMAALPSARGSSATGIRGNRIHGPWKKSAEVMGDVPRHNARHAGRKAPFQSRPNPNVSMVPSSSQTTGVTKGTSPCRSSLLTLADT
jgi:hypothetical protein